jgi:hypothetical protein
MVRKTTIALIALVTIAIGSNVIAHGRDILVSFNGGIGVIPAQSAAGTVNADGTFPDVRRNVVRGVVPGAGPWRIGDLKAVVTTDGRIRVRGRGLLLASGNAIGTNANQSVIATLICEAAAPFVEHTTTGAVPLEANGNFRIDDVLNPAPPAECASPVLLIRSAGGAWFAAGIATFGDDD